MKIGVVVASSRFAPERAHAVDAWMAAHFPDRSVSVVFHPSCFLKSGHFAGDDKARADAFVDFANDPPSGSAGAATAPAASPRP
jgi:muramoyltetrapeptide carboxypeptidase